MKKSLPVSLQAFRLWMVTIVLAISLLPSPALSTVIDIFGPSVPRFPLSVFAFKSRSSDPKETQISNELYRILTKDLTIAGFFEMIDSSRALADPFARGFSRRAVDWEVLRLLGADVVIGGKLELKGDTLRWEVRAYDLPQRIMLFGKVYKGHKRDFKLMAHRFADEVVRYYTGAPGIFQTKIAFLSKREGLKGIYVMDADGEDPRPLTAQRTIHLSPRWSPDGRFLAYIAYHGPKASLFLMNLRTGKSRVLSSRRDMNGPAAWAPDGNRLALTLTIHGNPELYVIDLNGKILSRLTHHPSIDVSPSWSPDGKSIAFVSNRSGGPQIYVLEIESRRIRRITYNGQYNTDPAWSPKGGLIAYTSLLNGNYEICTVRPDGSRWSQLTESKANDEAPAWSPDGRYIAFSSTRSGRAQIYIMLGNGENEVRITDLPGEQSSPTWSPMSP